MALLTVFFEFINKLDLALVELPEIFQYRIKLVHALVLLHEDIEWRFDCCMLVLGFNLVHYRSR